jgi:hypothetical protein
MDYDFPVEFGYRELIGALFLLAYALLSKFIHRLSECLLSLNFKLFNLRHHSQRIQRHHWRAAWHYFEIYH